MTSRPRLITSIPYWILVVGSLVLSGIGLFMVVDRLGKLDGSLRDPAADQVEAAVNVYVGQPAAVVGAVVLAAGLIGLLLALALAAAKSLLPQSDVAVVETIDWNSEGESAPEMFAAEPATTVPSTTVPATPATTAAPVIAEDPDVEVPSTTPAPAAATHDEPAILTEPAADDDKRV
jgi:hypothetical protein